jgi:hypothetical protein
VIRKRHAIEIHFMFATIPLRPTYGDSRRIIIGGAAEFHLQFAEFAVGLDGVDKLEGRVHRAPGYA